MNLRNWAEHLMQATAPEEIIKLHAEDTKMAFVAGRELREGQSLSNFYDGHDNSLESAAAAAAISRLSECDDIHLPSCVTPGCVVISVALASGASGPACNRAVAAGYTAGLRLGLSIGGPKALACGVWPALLATPLMAAVTASCLAGHNADQLAHAMALALAGASGRIGRPAGAPSGRWFLFAEAVLKGLRASEAGRQGFRGDLNLLSKPWLQVQAGHNDVDVGVFESAAPAPSICDVGFKPFPIARQGANAVIAFQRVLERGLGPKEIDSVEVFVPAINAALLSRPVQGDDRLSRISNMGFQLACAALAPEMLYDAGRTEPPNVPLMEFATRVSVQPAKDLDCYLPERWPARVVVNAHDSRSEETIVQAPFDHDAPGLAEMLDEKRHRLFPDRDQTML